MPSCNIYHLTWVSLTLGMGYLLFQQSAANAPYLGRGVSPHRRPSWPSTWDSSSWPSCARAATAWGWSSRPTPLASGGLPSTLSCFILSSFTAKILRSLTLFNMYTLKIWIKFTHLNSKIFFWFHQENYWLKWPWSDLFVIHISIVPSGPMLSIIMQSPTGPPRSIHTRVLSFFPCSCDERGMNCESGCPKK